MDAVTDAHVEAVTDVDAVTDAHVDATPKLGATIVRMQAKVVLVRLSWKLAVAAAFTALGMEAPLEWLIFEALR